MTGRIFPEVCKRKKHPRLPLVKCKPINFEEAHSLHTLTTNSDDNELSEANAKSFLSSSLLDAFVEEFTHMASKKNHTKQW